MSGNPNIKAKKIPHENQRRPKNRVKPFLWSLLFALIAVYVGYRFVNSDFDPQAFQLLSPPVLEGVLASNNRLRNAQLLLNKVVNGPESVLVEGDVIFTGTMDGRVLKIVHGDIVKQIKFTNYKNCGIFETESLCGRPLGIRRLNAKFLVVADAYLGIYLVDFENGTFEVILKPNDPRFKGNNPKFFNDVDVLDEHTIIFSDSSVRWNRLRFMYLLLEQRGDGRVYKFDIKSGVLETLLTGLNFPNGVQIHLDRSSVLVSECGRARVLRYYFSGPKNGHIETFLTNLPGFPDNLRLSSDGTKIYVALASIRHSEKLSFLDYLGAYPSVRKAIMTLIPPSWLSTLFQLVKPSYGIFIVVNAKDGKILESLHDPTGLINDISQVTDDKNFYYLGSFHAGFIAKVPMKGF